MPSVPSRRRARSTLPTTCRSRTSSRCSRRSCCNGPWGRTSGEALEHLLDQALSHQFPKHPKFGQEIKPGKDLRQVLEVCQEAARTPEGRVFVEDKAVRQKLRNICNPLELGQMSETHFVLDSFWKNHFNRLLAQSGQPHPTVGGPAAVDGPAGGARACPVRSRTC